MGNSKPEIMSPAGFWPQLGAAIEAGADAVYFGLRHFSARAKVGFSLAELPEVMATLHRRGVKGYITFNTLVFDHEVAEAARGLAAIAEAGADAIIVQDLGIVRLARQIAPDLDHPRQHPDERHQRARRAAGAGAGREPRHPGARAFARPGARHTRRHRLRTRDLRPRRAVRGLLRPVFLLGSLGRPQRQSRPVRAGLPTALRDDRGRPARRRSAMPATCSRRAISMRCARFRRSCA